MLAQLVNLPIWHFLNWQFYWQFYFQIKLEQMLGSILSTPYSISYWNGQDVIFFMNYQYLRNISCTVARRGFWLQYDRHFPPQFKLQYTWLLIKAHLCAIIFWSSMKVPLFMQFFGSRNSVSKWDSFKVFFWKDTDGVWWIKFTGYPWIIIANQILLVGVNGNKSLSKIICAIISSFSTQVFWS